MNHHELATLLKPQTAIIDQAMRQDLTVVTNPLLQEVLTYAIFNGGKRIRPLLTVLTTRLCWQTHSPDKSEQLTTDLYRLALTFEYLHAASLLHDDVIDQSDSRRGRSTANRVWDNTHVILAGDFLHARAMLLAGTIGGLDCLSIVSQATAAMVESEFIQLENAAQLNASLDRYFEVLTGKTAALIAAAACTGVIFARGSAKQQSAVHTFATNLGLTFQIIDDLLDYLGDPGETGKAVGNDFQERKMTLPVIFALDQASPHDRNTLLELLNNSENATTARFKTARDIISRAGGFQKSREKAEDLIREAIGALDLFASGPELDLLIALSRYVLNRKQ